MGSGVSGCKVWFWGLRGSGFRVQHRGFRVPALTQETTVRGALVRGEGRRGALRCQGLWV